MDKRNEFDRRTGRRPVPTANAIPRTIEPIFEHELAAVLAETQPWQRYRICSKTLKEGCYALTFSPKARYPSILQTAYKGTLRLETAGTDLIVSADLYRFKARYPLKYYGIAQKYERLWGIDTEITAVGNIQREAILVDRFELPRRKSIPIYPRGKYFSYLQGVSAELTSLSHIYRPCSFSFTFDEFFYQHPATGFDGSFPATADRTVRMALSETGTADYYEGKLFEGSTELGTITLCWVSPFFRRAELSIRRLQGAVIPEAVPAAGGSGTEDFSTIFATAGWHLSVSRDNTAVALPASLAGVQDPTTCWNPNFDNMHDLMDSLSGYAPSELDTRWRAHLVAIPATLGCSRGWMFDTGGGDVNDVAREGAVTQSHDGYPAGDAGDYGVAEDELQKDHPRAFLRSAAHEVGHTFNQIHQNFEGGSDNSIMTVTPQVAVTLNNAGEDFPDDIDLSFNATVRRHLIHLPDPAVRPGAMDFFGTAVTAPQADVDFFDPADLELALDLKDSVKLGEPVRLRWSLENRSGDPIPVPERIDAEHQVARISVTDPIGQIKYMRPFMGLPCTRLRVSALEPGKKLQAESVVFWSREGFAFHTPGRHRVDVILMWDIDGLVVGARASTHVWVDFPVTHDENDVAALMLDEDVGKFVARGGGARYPKGFERAKRVLERYEKHPACRVLEDLPGPGKKGKKGKGKGRGGPPGKGKGKA